MDCCYCDVDIWKVCDVSRQVKFVKPFLKVDLIYPSQACQGVLTLCWHSDVRLSLCWLCESTFNALTRHFVSNSLIAFLIPMGEALNYDVYLPIELLKYSVWWININQLSTSRIMTQKAGKIDDLFRVAQFFRQSRFYSIPRKRFLNELIVTSSLYRLRSKQSLSDESSIQRTSVVVRRLNHFSLFEFHL